MADINTDRRSQSSECSQLQTSYDGHSFDNEDVELFIHKNKKHFLEREVKVDDTLQALALEFNVTVEELKRSNNIHKENEIHARRIIRVPAKPSSLLVNTTNEEISLSEFSQPIPTTSSSEFEKQVEESKLTAELRFPVESRISTVLQDKNQELIKPIEDDINVDNEETNLLTETEVVLTSADNNASQTHCNGADWGISWPVIFLLALVVGIGGPVYYIWFFLEAKAKPS